MTAASALYRTHRYDDWRLLGLASLAGPATFLLFAGRRRPVRGRESPLPMGAAAAPESQQPGLLAEPADVDPPATPERTDGAPVIAGRR